jgi:hypothetical protein
MYPSVVAPPVMIKRNIVIFGAKKKAPDSAVPKVLKDLLEEFPSWNNLILHWVPLIL